MDLAWSATDLAFRDEVRVFLQQKLTPELRAAGRLMTSVYADHDASMEWQRILHERGWAAPAWPVEYGGCDWSLTQHYIFSRESQLAGAPSLSPMGIRMVAHAIIKFGTDALAVLNLEAEPDARARAVSAAKATVGRAARFIGQQAVQLHGGMGMTEELAIGHYFKRLTALQYEFGSTDYHVKRYAELTKGESACRAGVRRVGPQRITSSRPRLDTFWSCDRSPEAASGRGRPAPHWP
ncbi:MAG: hypothetical protein NVS4B6_00950 [Mycobacterium sp.]